MTRVSRREFCHWSLAAGALLAGGGTSRAATTWVDQRQMGPFVCLADFPLVGYESLLQELAPLERELRRVLALEPCQSPIYLHLLADERRYRHYLRERFPDVPYRRALFIKQGGQAHVFAFRHAELADDVRHECTHALLHADLPMVPLWLDEGLAEYFEVEASRRARHHPHLRALHQDLRRGRLLDMDHLEARRSLEDLTGEDYRFAWAWTHFMLHGPAPVHAELVAFLNDIRHRAAPGSLSARLSRIAPRLPDRFLYHFQRLREA